MSTTDDQNESASPAARVLTLMAAKRKDEASKLLVKHYSTRLHSFFMRNSLREYSEEMMADTFFKFLTMKNLPRNFEAGEAYLYQIARRVLVDEARRRSTASRGGRQNDGPAEVLVDDEELLEALAYQGEPSEDPNWIRELKQCIEVAMAEMRKAVPTAVEALWLKYRDYSPEEVAIYYGADPNRVTEGQRHAATVRLSKACNTARPYFSHCKE